MNDQLINLTVAKLAKEKGFNERTNYGYYENEISTIGYVDYNYNNKRETFSAPSQTILQRWLREVHNIHIIIEHHNYDRIDGKLIMMFHYKIYKNSSSNAAVFSQTGHISYETLLEEALQKGLELI